MSPRSRELAAVLACGSGALLSHRTAGARWALVRAGAGIEVTVPRSRGRHPGIVVHRSRSLHPDDRAVVDAIPATSPARTLIDLAEVLSDRHLADAVHAAEVQRILDLRTVEAALARVPGRRGRHRLHRVLAAYAGGPPLTRSEAERRFLRLCADHALPTPQSNVLVDGYEVDFHWPAARLVVEVDGAAAHHTRKAFHEDRRRDRILASLGIQVLRVTWKDLEEGGAPLAGELRRALLARC